MLLWTEGLYAEVASCDLNIPVIPINTTAGINVECIEDPAQKRCTAQALFSFLDGQHSSDPPESGLETVKSIPHSVFHTIARPVSFLIPGSGCDKVARKSRGVRPMHIPPRGETTLA